MAVKRPKTRQEVAEILARKVRAKRRNKEITGRGVKPSRNVAAFYYRELRKGVKALRADIEAEVLPVLAEVEGIRDAVGPMDFVREAVAGLAAQSEAAEALPALVAEKLDRSNRRAFTATMRSTLGIDISKVLSDEGIGPVFETFVSDNVALIKSIPEQYHDKVLAAVTQGFESGDDFFSIRKSILEIGESTERRAKLIARDQVSKMNSALNQVRQTQLGIERYRWRTSRDERVRDTHRANAGKVFRWDTPPPETGHPGHDINCRCTAEPVILDDIDGSILSGRRFGGRRLGPG